MINAVKAAAWTALWAFLGTAALLLSGFLTDVASALSGGADFPSIEPVVKALIAAFVAAFSGVIGGVVRAVQIKTGKVGTVPAYQADPREKVA